MAIALAALGGIVCVVAGIWLLVLAFQESALWGLGCLLVPFVSLIFVIQFWDKAETAFLVNLGGGVLLGIGAAMGGL